MDEKVYPGSPRAPGLGVVWAFLLMTVLVMTPALAADGRGQDGAGRSVLNLSVDDGSPWGVASGAEWLSGYPQFNPLLAGAGVKWLRAFQEWQTLEPRRGYWNWAAADHLVQNARSNNIRLAWVLAYLAPWASANGGTRTFPVKDIQYWRDYVSHVVERYRGDIKYWEVWNEFNGSFAENGTPSIYAELVREASMSAKAVDPSAKIGLSVANFDIHFLDAAIKAGAAGHFDYICVHPYEKMGLLEEGGEADFLAMAASLRQMLADNRQPADIPLWISEIGEQSSVTADPKADEKQALALAKSYLLALASGFQKVFWFEARGPSYGNNTDHGLIRSDFTLRPSYRALKTLSSTLGPTPLSKGWVELGEGGFGFVFAAGDRSVLAAWAPVSGNVTVHLAGDMRVVDLSGQESELKAGHELVLTRVPVLILDPPAQIREEAARNQGRPYPWGGGYAQADLLTVKLGPTNAENGIRQVRADTTVTAGAWQESARRMNFARADNEGHYAYFSVDPGFVRTGPAGLEIRVIARRLDRSKVAGFAITYESRSGYVGTGYANIPEGDEWHELSWTVDDANFAGQWGWNFRVDAIASPNEFLIKEVRVRRVH